jgi:dATP pyrophosphohydrolase
VAYKIPISVLVVIHKPPTCGAADRTCRPAGFWQSSPAARKAKRAAELTAVREVGEETGSDARLYPLHNWNKQDQFEIFSRWSGPLCAGTTHNTEHVFSLELPAALPVTLAPQEHCSTVVAVARSRRKVFFLEQRWRNP